MQGEDMEEKGIKEKDTKLKGIEKKNMEKLPGIFNRYQPFIEDELKSLFTDFNLPLYDMMKYHMGWINSDGSNAGNSSGKMLRAILCLMACEALAGDFKKALPQAAAIELIHNYSLIHDDIQDGDELRRHRPTVWKVWGMPQAINAGSALKIIAGISIFKLEKYQVPAKKILEIFKILEKSSLQMIEGQYMDIAFESIQKIPIEDYIKMIEKKTSALISGALMAGAAIGDNHENLEKFERFGKYLGISFQIKDDLLGIWGNNAKTGKPGGNDIRKRKKSLPIVYFLQYGDKKTVNKLIKIYNGQKVSERNVSFIINNLNNSGARQFCEERAEAYFKLALDTMEYLPLSEEMLPHFREISEFLIMREF